MNVIMNSQCLSVLLLMLLGLKTALVCGAAPPVNSTTTLLLTSRHRQAGQVVAETEVLGCQATVHKAAGSKANFILEPLVCWRAGMELLLCPGFDYLRSKHFLRVPVLLTDPAALGQAKRQLHLLFPTSLQFMDIESASFQLMKTDQTVDIKLEEAFGSAEGRKYLIIRVYCASLDHCQDIRLGLAAQPSLLFDQLRLSMSSGTNVTGLQQTVRRVWVGPFTCRSDQRRALEGSPDRRGGSSDSEDRRTPEAAVSNQTKLIEVDGQLHFLVQQRSDGAVSFQRGWEEYENGFGSLSGDNWMGLRLMHSLTKVNRVLRVELVRFRGHKFHQDFFHAEYNDFRVGPPPLYPLSYTALNKARSSVLGDALSESRGRGFSTADRDNDLWSSSCSQLRGGGGGWWFSSCGASNPNGAVHGANSGNESAIRWGYLDSIAPSQRGETLKSVRILLRV